MSDEELTRAMQALARDRILVAALMRLPRDSQATSVSLDQLVDLVEGTTGGKGPSRSSLWQGLRAMENAGLGSISVGRRKSPTRIELPEGVTVRRLLRSLEVGPRGDDRVPTRTAGLGDASNPEMVPYRFPVRPGVMAELVLPVDLTATEVERLTLFLQSLATR